MTPEDPFCRFRGRSRRHCCPIPLKQPLMSAGVYRYEARAAILVDPRRRLAESTNFDTA